MSDPIIIHYDNHNAIKDELLRLIDKTNSEFSQHDGESITTDWYVSNQGADRSDYFDLFLKHFQPVLNDYMNNIVGYPDCPWFVSGKWFQQYKTGGTHNWHIHAHCAYSCVYYLEHPKDGPGTEFIKPFFKLPFTIYPNEGDLLIFPSIWKHRSPPNNSHSRKTVIAFNINYENID